MLVNGAAGQFAAEIAKLSAAASGPLRGPQRPSAKHMVIPIAGVDLSRKLITQN